MSDPRNWRNSLEAELSSLVPGLTLLVDSSTGGWLLPAAARSARIIPIIKGSRYNAMIPGVLLDMTVQFRLVQHM